VTATFPEFWDIVIEMESLSEVLLSGALTLFPVSRSPLNEDVFTTPLGCETRTTTPDVVQLSERIHRLLVRPVHSGSSQGRSSLGSRGSRGSRRSHLQRLGASGASSSDGNGLAVDKVAAAVTLHKPVSPSNQCFKSTVCHVLTYCYSRPCHPFNQFDAFILPDDLPADL